MAEEAKRPGIFQHLALWGYQLFCGALKLVSIRVVALVGRVMGYLVWAAIPSRRLVVARNLRIVVDPMLRQDKLGAMVRRNIVRTTMNLFCSLKTGLLTDAEMKQSVNIIGADTFRSHGENGHCVISCVPHAGNWEIFARIRPVFTSIEHYGSLYRQLANPLLEKAVYESRTRHGCEMYSKQEGLRSVLKLARTGGLLGILSDQYTQEGIFLPYFGKVTGVTPLPALLYKRCKGKGHLFSVFSKNTGLGTWDAQVGRMIHLPENCETLEAITMQVNLALEECQNESILDGFWMHHRWKSTAIFAPPLTEESKQLIAEHVRLPFRTIVAVPETFEEAVLTIPMLRVLKGCRSDMQLTIVCPQEQQAFWRTQPYISFVNVSDGPRTLQQQMNEDEQYKDGPYDILYMLNENSRILRQIITFGTVTIFGYKDSKLLHHRKIRGSRVYTHPSEHCHAPQHRAEDYLDMLRQLNGLMVEEDDLTTPIGGQESCSGSLIAPFSTLSSTDTWAEEKWTELIRLLPGKVSMLALEADKTAATAMAKRLGIPLLCCSPQELAQHVGPHCRLYAVDGLLPQLAALAGCPCTVIMANRLADRYVPFGHGHRAVFDHLPDYPCYGKGCEKRTHATAGISVEDVLG